MIILIHEKQSTRTHTQMMKRKLIVLSSNKRAETTSNQQVYLTKIFKKIIAKYIQWTN